MRRLSNRGGLGVVMALVASYGCTLIFDFPELVPAHRWCLDADPATGRRNNNFQLIEITDLSGAWTRGCKCYCPADHTIMLAGANGELDPGSEDEVWYGIEVGLLRASAASACDDRTAELEADQGIFITFDDPETISCLASVADETPFLATECVLNEDICPPGAPGGFGTDGYVPGTSTNGTTAAEGTAADETATDGDVPGTGGATAIDDGTSASGSNTDGGAGVFGPDDWTTAIDCPLPDRCDVEAAFVEELLADLGVLSDDSINIRPGASRLGHYGLVFAELGPDSFPAALGLRRGDVLWRVSGIELRTLADVGRAFELLHQATVLTAEIDRGSVTLERTYRIVEQLGER
jgi:hypothetical protein